MKIVRWKKIKLNSRLIKGFVVITMLELLAVGVFTYFYSNQLSENTANEITQSNHQELERSGESLDAIIEQLYNCVYYISIDTNLRLFSIAQRPFEETEALEVIRSTMDYFKKVLGYVENIEIYLEKNDYCVSASGTLESGGADWKPLYEQTAEAQGGELYYLFSRCKKGQYPFLMTMIYPLYSEHKRSGAVVIDVNLEKLSEAIGRDDEDPQVLYMLGKDGRLLYSSDPKVIKYPDLLPSNWGIVTDAVGKQKEIAELNREDEEYIVTMMPAAFGGYYVLYSPQDYYRDRMELTKQYVARNALWTLGVSMLVSIVLTLYSYYPIRRIIDEIEADENTWDEFVSEKNKGDEIRYISDMIRGAKRKNAQLSVEMEDWIRQLSHAQVQALQSQINPHFLYNTLDSINWMIMERLGKETEVNEVIYSLAKLLRMSMKRSSYLITLEEELEHARIYLELLTIRYPGRITAHWEVDESLSEVKVVRLCLQPIIENAVMHGLKKKRYYGDIYVWGGMVNDTLMIRIEDNGVGMSRDECFYMNRELETEYRMADNHVGIRNVNQRMKILFGEDYGVRLCPRTNGGLTVYLCFPLEVK